MGTLPPGLQVRDSGIPEAGLGVWAKEDYPVRSCFGPYEGDLIRDEDTAHSSGYSWQASGGGSTLTILRVSDKTGD